MSQDAATTQETKPMGFWRLFVIMALVALASMAAGVPTCGISMFLSGTIAAYVRMRLEKPARELIMKKSAAAGALAGVSLGFLAGTMMLFVPDMTQNAAAWPVMLLLVPAVMALFSALTGLLGGAFYRSQQAPKPAAALEAAAQPTSAPGPAQPLEGVLDLTDIGQGEVIPIQAEDGWVREIVQQVARDPDHLRVVLLRDQLEVMILNSRFQMDPGIGQTGVTAIGYNTGDQENEALLRNGSPIVLLPKDVAMQRPLCFEVPARVTGVDFFILRQSRDTLRIVRRPAEFQQLRIKVGME